MHTKARNSEMMQICRTSAFNPNAAEAKSMHGSVERILTLVFEFVA